MIKLYVFVCGAMLFLSPVIFGQEQSGAVYTDNGILVVWNEPGNYYAIEIKGKNIEPFPNRQLWFTVDGTILQILTSPKKPFTKNGKDAKSVLIAHMGIESDYVGENLKAQLKIDSSWVKLPNGADGLMWSFDMPNVADSPTTIKRQLYLTALKRDHLFLLNIPLSDRNKEKDMQAFLIETIASLKPADKSIDIKKISDAGRSEN